MIARHIEPEDARRVLLSALEAADALGVSERLLRDLTAPRGDLPAVRLGRRVMYRRETLERWAADREGRADGSPR